MTRPHWRWLPAAALAAAAAGCGLIVEATLLIDAQRRERDDSPAPAPSPPVVELVAVPDPAVDRTTVDYRLRDAEGSPADLTVEWSGDGGATWNPCTEAPVAPSEGTSGLAASPAGILHAFVWDAYADVGPVDVQAQLRLQARDAATGASGGAVVSPALWVRGRYVVTLAGGAASTLNFPGGVAVDGNGRIYVADTLGHRIRVLNTQSTAATVAGVTIAAGQLATIAGTGTAGYNGDNRAAAGAQLSFPGRVALDGAGHVYVADSLNHRVRRIDAATGFITTVVGTGTAGSTGNGGLATVATVKNPRGLALDGTGNLYLADTDNNVVRVVNQQASAITLAGVTIQPGRIDRLTAGGGAGSSGDGGVATAAKLAAPLAVAVDGNGQVYVADTGNHAIRVINVGTTAVSVAGTNLPPGRIDTVAGTNGTAGLGGDGAGAASALLDSPAGIVVDGSGTIVIADRGNDRVRVVNGQAASLTWAGVTIAPGDVDTVAGGGAGATGNQGDGGAATAARLAAPEGVALLAGGHLALADTGLSRIRIVNVGTASTMVGVVTIAGGDIDSVAGSVSLTPTLLRPTGVAVAGARLFVADGDADVVYELNLVTRVLTVAAGTGVGGFTGDGGAASQARLDEPEALALDATGNLYISDRKNNRVRVVNRQATAQTLCGVTVGSGDIATVAGGGSGGDGGAATSATINDTRGIAIGSGGHLFLAHRGGNRVRRVDAGTGVITTAAGTGTAGFTDGARLTTARCRKPQGVHVDAAGNLVVADTDNHAIRYANLGASTVTVVGVAIAAGDVGTVAGIPPATGPTAGWNGDNQSAIQAWLDSPRDAWRLAGGHLLVVDEKNERVRRVDQGTGLIATVLGIGAAGYNGDGIPAVNAAVNAPARLTVDGTGGVMVTDSTNRRVRRFGP